MNLLTRLLPERDERRHTIDTVDDWFMFGGHAYPFGMGARLTSPGVEMPTVEHSFAAYAEQVFKASGPVFALEAFRMRVFSSVRFMFQRMREGRPQDLFGTRALQVLDRPWPGGTTQNLLQTALMYRDLAGNAYAVARDPGILFLRPDWMRVVFRRRDDRLGVDLFGYLYYPDGDVSGDPEPLDPGEVAHFAGEPDPQAPWRGMSWLTPVIRDFQLDSLTTSYMQQYMSNSATPNLAVSLKETVGAKAFKDFVELFEEKYKGVDKAGETLFVGGGADVKVVGSDLSQLSLKDLTGGFENRLASAAGVHPVVVGFREGMQGSALNAGNYGMARRSTADGTFHPLWQDISGSLEPIIQTPGDARLWYDTRGVPFLREDAKDEAVVRQRNAATISTLIAAGFDPATAVLTVTTGDFKLLEDAHTGLVSVQLQTPGVDDIGDGDPDDGDVDDIGDGDPDDGDE